MGKHPLFYKLFSCPFCLGFHSGYFIYLLSHHFRGIDLFDLALHSLLGAGASLLFFRIVGIKNDE